MCGIYGLGCVVLFVSCRLAGSIPRVAVLGLQMQDKPLAQDATAQPSRTHQLPLG